MMQNKKAWLKAVGLSIIIPQFTVAAGVNLINSPIISNAPKFKPKKLHLAINRHNVFTSEKGLPPDKYRYIVQLINDPVALYKGQNPKFFQAKFYKNSQHKMRIDLQATATVKYRSFLKNQQKKFINSIDKYLGTNLDVKQQTQLAFNGLVIEMTQAQASELAKNPSVKKITREILTYPQTDAGPRIIKAPSIWDGTATGIKSKGEGMIIGIIDTGINSDNPSFSSVGGDGYKHKNPWGSGNYAGDCKTNYPQLCNDKLIGVYSWPVLTSQYLDHDVTVAPNGEDHNGHGSHTAGTAGGNILNDQEIENVDGGGSGVKLKQISGVAPHANIISYQVCLPGENDAINFRGCFPSLTILAIEHAIEDGVDVLNYSIGGRSQDPWQDPDSIAFLAARRAGIQVATSAGNSGPEPETIGSPADAPWITSVAAYTHDRTFSSKSITDITTGEADKLPNLTGEAMTGGVSGSVVYAGDYPNDNDPDGDAAQCLKPYPAQTFPPNTIVVCDRGQIARVDKGKNVKHGGAAGLILTNIDGGAESVVADAHVLPAIQIDAKQGNILKEWLNNGNEEHTVKISASIPITNDKQARIAADFTSRGPNPSVPNVLSPSIAAPGVQIYAPYADSQSAYFKSNPDPRDFAFLSGTSMASPHIAGALALLKSIHPSWTPAEIQSAIMLTANENTRKENGETHSDPFDDGSGFANIENAAKTGIVLDESYSNYLLADPSFGGDPSELNLPSLANESCASSCSWKRTVTATKAGSWVTQSNTNTDAIGISISPHSFTLAKGESKQLTITANMNDKSRQWQFGDVSLHSGNGSPNVHLPLAVKYSQTGFPNAINIRAGRNRGVITFNGFNVNNSNDFSVGVYDKYSPLIDEPIELQVPDGKSVTQEFDLAENGNVRFTLDSTTAPDLDLRILDSEQNLIGQSASSSSHEVANFNNLPAGKYYIVVDSYQASAPGAVDDATINIDTIKFDQDSLSDSVIATLHSEDTENSVDFKWDTNNDITGYFAAVDTEGNVIDRIPFSLSHFSDVTIHQSLTDALQPNQPSHISFEIAPNLTSHDKIYQLDAAFTPGHKIANVDHNGELTENNIHWQITQPAKTPQALFAGFDLIPKQAGRYFAVKLSNSLDGDTISSTYKFGVLEANPVIQIQSPKSVKEGQTVSITTKGTYDPNGTHLSYTWTQTSGVPLSFNKSLNTLTVKIPILSESNENFRFSLLVSNKYGKTTTENINLHASK